MAMRKVKMIRLLLLLVCLFTYHLSSGQHDFVVLTKGDTIKGKVKYLDYRLEKQVQVTTADHKKIVYSILQTVAFRMKDDLYHPVRTPQGYTYMKILKSGYLSYYAFQFPNQPTWDGRYLLKKDGSGLEIPNISFKKLMTRYLSDCASVTEKIESGELGRLKIEEIVDHYNACIDLSTNAHNLANEQTKEKATKINTWNELEASLKSLADFDDKATALEMVNEIKIKVQRGERVPSFLTEGLKEALKDQGPSVNGILDKALHEL